MKKTALLALLCLLAAFLTPAEGQTITSSNLVTYASLTGTNDSVPIYIGNAYIAAPPNYVFSQGGLASTNAAAYLIQYGFDTNNFSTTSTYTFSTTNSTAVVGDGVVSSTGLSIPIYARVRIVTTNAVSTGAKAVFIR